MIETISPDEPEAQKIQLASVVSEDEDERLDVAPYRIYSYPADYTLQVLHEKWKNEEISIPPFQRRFVWTLQKATRLIESFLLGLPVPGIFLYRNEASQKLLVVDGQQRLKSVFGFFDGVAPNNRRTFHLNGARPKWDGLRFEQLDPADQIRLKDSVLRATIIAQMDNSDDTSMYQIFERLNNGGVVLHPQEIRNCIYQGRFNDLLSQLNQLQAWRDILGSPQPDNRMRDIELVLRSLALAFDADHYSKPMRDFLGRFMSANNCADPNRLRALEVAFSRAAKCVVKSLGNRPFNIHRGVNKAVCDSVMAVFLNQPDVSPGVRDRYEALIRNNAYVEYVSSGTTDVDTVKKRLDLAREYLAPQ